jgi:hypothetical protein
MKARFLITVLACFGAFSALSWNDYPMEDAMFACLVSDANAIGIDLETSLDEMEQLLIENNVLSGNDGAAKIAYYNKIIEEGQTPLLIKSDTRDRLMEVAIKVKMKTVCIDELRKRETFSESKFYKLVRAIEILVEQEEINFGSISEAVVEILDAKDFEHPFYRAYMVLTCFKIMDLDEAYVRELPKRIEQDAPYIPEDVFEFNLTADSRLAVEGKHCTPEELKAKMHEFLMKEGSSFVVRFLVSKQCKYQQYVDAVQLYNEVYNRIYNEEGLDLYGAYFFKLSDEQKAGIEKRYPKIREEESIN